MSMNLSTISIIAAIGEGNRVIGDHGNLPWHLSEDLKRFKLLTTGHPIILGKNTFLSIGRALPNRTNIVLADHEWTDAPKDVTVAHSLEEAIAVAERAEGSEEIFVIGGGMVYREALPLADRLYLTLIHGNFSGDVFFPEYEAMFSNIVNCESREGDGYHYDFLILEK